MVIRLSIFALSSLLKLSKTGTLNTLRQKAITPTVGDYKLQRDVLSIVLTKNMAINIPIIKVPESPINILDVLPKTL